MTSKPVIAASLLAIAMLALLPLANAAPATVDSHCHPYLDCCGEDGQLVQVNCVQGDNFCDVWVNGWCCDTQRNRCNIFAAADEQVASRDALRVAAA